MIDSPLGQGTAALHWDWSQSLPASAGGTGPFLIAVAAAMIAMLVIPICARLAPRLGMLDTPSARKVHATPIPRVGGLGIVLGALIPLLLWLPLEGQQLWFLFGALVLLGFGVWDDIQELGHYVKFFGQFLAVIPLVYLGDLHVSRFPLLPPDALPDGVERAFTVVALVGMINAINHSDGLDGLAGGESLLSLLAILFLGLAVDAELLVAITLATAGGVLGFLRYNSHPARVFMGDGGSQFLGYTLGVLAILLTQQDYSAVSPAAALLLLGLPIADIIGVFVQRVAQGQNWFRASSNHIHHRLLGRGLHHYEAVALIYLVQAGLVSAGYFLRFESDLLLLSLYLVAVATIFVALTLAERRGWQRRRQAGSGTLVRLIRRLKGDRELHRHIGDGVGLLLAALLLGGALWAAPASAEIALASGVLSVLLLLRLLAGFRLWFLMLRLLVFLSLAVVLHLGWHSPQLPAWVVPTLWPGFILLALLVLTYMRFAPGQLFAVSPLDLLVALVILSLIILPDTLTRVGVPPLQIAALLVLFYAAEVALRNMRQRWSPITLAALASSALVALRSW